jgi:hypothetical protein
VGASRGLVHSFITTPANEHNLSRIPEIMNGEGLFVSVCHERWIPLYLHCELTPF